MGMSRSNIREIRNGEEGGREGENYAKGNMGLSRSDMKEMEGCTE